MSIRSVSFRHDLTCHVVRSFTCYGHRLAGLLLLGLWPSGRIWAAGEKVVMEDVVSPKEWMGAGFLVVAAMLAIWLTIRRERKHAMLTVREKRISFLLEHADCLLWEAEVDTKGERWDDWDSWGWKFTLQPSGLARRLFAGIAPPWDITTWNGLEVPEKPEMNRRCLEAMRAGRSGYEQQFRLIRPDGVLWLRESVTILPRGGGRFFLVGLTTDVTAQHETEAARRTSEDQLNQLLAHANCMLWRAKVQRDSAGDFTGSSSCRIRSCTSASPASTRATAP